MNYTLKDALYRKLATDNSSRYFLLYKSKMTYTHPLVLNKLGIINFSVIEDFDITYARL